MHEHTAFDSQSADEWLKEQKALAKCYYGILYYPRKIALFFICWLF